MNEVNRTLYIPLYGKALVSRRGILLRDETAQMIWDREGFPLRGKAKSRWLAYYMGMRAAVFDRWLEEKLRAMPGCLVLHIGCGLDSRVRRVDCGEHLWYDVDLPPVIRERQKYFQGSEHYHMLEADARETAWLDSLPAGLPAAVVMEGVSMYLRRQELTALLGALSRRFDRLSLLMDCYTQFAARVSRYKNPVNDVGVTTLYGVDDPLCLETEGLRFMAQHELTPPDMVLQLTGVERVFFRTVFTGNAAKKIYRLYEYGKQTDK